MTERTLPGWLSVALELGPVLGFLAAYLVFGGRTFDIFGAERPGLVVVAVASLPVFALASGALWLIEGRIARVQLVALGAMVLFAGLSAWMADARLFKMKPTIVYLVLGLTLGAGLLRGKSWLRIVMEDVLPLKKRGWRILTRRVTAFCFAAAAANELVWRTQSEARWVLFETLAMPVIVLVFLAAQIGLFVEHTAIGSTRRKR